MLVASSLGRNGVRLALQRRAQSVPREGRALHADGILRNSRERLELPEVIVRFAAVFARHYVVEFLEQLFGFLGALAFHCLRHHRRRRFRNGATGALEGDIANLAVSDFEINREMIAAERIETFGLAISGFERAVIPRTLAVLQNDVLI